MRTLSCSRRARCSARPTSSHPPLGCSVYRLFRTCVSQRQIIIISLYRLFYSIQATYFVLFALLLRCSTLPHSPLLVFLRAARFLRVHGSARKSSFGSVRISSCSNIRILDRLTLCMIIIYTIINNFRLKNLQFLSEIFLYISNNFKEYSYKPMKTEFFISRNLHLNLQLN